LSDHDIWFFLDTLRNVLLELQAQAAVGIAPIRPRIAGRTIRGLTEPRLAKVGL
jgi:2-aminoethylphosphonate-pyruvate transaminase